MTEYNLKSEIWKYPSDKASWYFVSVDKRISDKIKKEYINLKKGFGSLPVEVTVGKTTWKTSIFPQKDGPYLLPLKAKIRKDEGLSVGDKVNFSMSIIFKNDIMEKWKKNKIH